MKKTYNELLQEIGGDWQKNPEKYWDQIAKEFPFRGTWTPFNNMKQYFEVAEEHFRKMEHLLYDCDMESALDLGVGGGRTLFPLVARFKKVYGVDISEKLLKIAKENMHKIGYDIITIKTENDKIIGVKDNSISYVNSITVMQHIYSWNSKQILREEIFRVLKSGGIACIDETCPKVSEVEIVGFYEKYGFKNIILYRQNEENATIWLKK